MKKLLFILSAIIFGTVQAQEHCSLNAQYPINMGLSADYAEELLIQTDGKIIAVGTSNYSNHYEAALVRMNPDLTLDQSFGVNGRVGHTWEQRNNAGCAALDEQGRIYVGGFQAPGSGSSTIRGYVGRMNSDGSPDTSFANLGSKKFDMFGGMQSGVMEVHPLSTGGVKVAMTTKDPRGHAVIQLTEAGELDTTFAGDGIALIPNSLIRFNDGAGEAVFLDGDTSVVIIGTIWSPGLQAPSHPYVAKIDSYGQLDTAFSADGEIVFPETPQYGPYVAKTENEDILFAFGTIVSSNYAPINVYKLDGLTGELVSDFGVDGLCLSNEDFGWTSTYDIVIDPSNNDILVLGTGFTWNTFPMVWRINEFGQEVMNCGGSAADIFQGISSVQGFRAGAFDASGELQIVGATVEEEPDAGVGQQTNFMFPYTSSPSGLFESDSKRIAVYPNPSSDFIQFENPNNEAHLYKISDITGRTVQQGISTGRIGIEGIKSGLHILTFVMDDSPRRSIPFVRR